MYKCKYCGKEFEKLASLAAHVSHCKENINRKRTKEYTTNINKLAHQTYILNHPEKYILQEFECICNKCRKKYIIITTQEKYNKGKYIKFCCTSCANSHILSDNTKYKISKSLKTSDKFKLQCLSTYKVYICKNCKKEFKLCDNTAYKSRFYCSKECKHEYLSKHTGGYREGSGFGKSGWYNGIKCDSTWELAYVIYNIDHNIHIERCKQYRNYIFNNVIHRYYPDFIVNHKDIIEIKGYSTKQWEAKIKQNPDIIVLYKNDIQFYLDYVINKYNVTDLTLLYNNIKTIKSN